jgi:hypothetical protein
VGVCPLQLISEIFRHKTSHMVLSIIFLENKHKIVLHLSIFYEYQQFFQHRICFSIQPPDYSDPWPTLARSTSFFLIMLFKEGNTKLVDNYRKTIKHLHWLVGFMVFSATINNISVISWRSVLLVEKTGVSGENHQPVRSHWQTLSHCTTRPDRDSNSQHQ